MIHPKCEDCGRPLYKTLEKGAPSAKSDPYQHCRNEECPSARRPHLVAVHRAIMRDEPRPVKSIQALCREQDEEAQMATPRRAMVDRKKGKPAPKALAEPAKEPEPVRKARERIRTLIKKATAGKDATAISLVLAIVNQETGHHKAADALIDEFKLDKTFGIAKSNSG